MVEVSMTPKPGSAPGAALHAMARSPDNTLTRGQGVALWRQIADQIRQAISAGTLGADGKLPPEMVLSDRFGVNRHTLRSAIAALVQEGLRSVIAKKKAEKEPFKLRDVSFGGDGLTEEFRSASWEQSREAIYEGRG